MRTVGLLVLITFSVTCTTSSADDAEATFYRGVNLNGPAITIDGHAWDGNDATDFRCNGNGFENQDVMLKPPTDAARSQMLRSSRWGREIDVELLNVPAGTYQVCLYVWEDNDATRFKLLLNDRIVIPEHDSRGAGIWKKLGPWTVKVTNGVIKVSARGGDANLSGLEIWSGSGPLPASVSPGFNNKPDEDQLAFFEKRIRPLLADRCYECHSQDSPELGGNLLLDSRPAIVKGGDTEPPVIPGDPDASLLITAVRRSNPDLVMPPEAPLSSEEVKDLETWIKMGAPDPRRDDTVRQLAAKSAIDWDKARDHWSLRPLKSPEAPAVQDTAWPTNEIDRFILARLENHQIAPSRDADRRVLLRRLTYDLTGLPPTPEEIDAFVQDSSTDAFDKVIDRLLDSPAYGERWGRHWLDVVRYADTAGDNSDFPIPQMYRYRNWVIEAFRRDLPYDEFVTQQLAGDLIDGGSVEESQQRTIATGYIANARRFGSRVDDYPQHLTIEDTLDNLGRTFLATTINCARCHNHKFDPITTEDYYALYGIFHSTRYPWPGIELEQHQRDLVPLASDDVVAATMTDRKARQDQLDAEVKRLEAARDKAQGEEQEKLKKDVEQARKAATDFPKSPLPYEQAYAVAEAKTIEDVAVQQKGDPAKPGTMVHRRFLTVVGGQEVPDGDQTSGRLQLARWIADRNNPLTARVMVNRIWAYHFGKGLVPTPNDFGRQGKSPTHPELLDWLAMRFMDSGWSVKSMHRLILKSRTYQLSSERDASQEAADPTNEWYESYPRRRLDAEAIRDTLLVLGGNLDSSTAGPHPFPPQTDWNFTQHNPFKANYETNRRSVYLMTQRTQRHPYLSIFDGADPSTSTPLRLVSTTPLQALFLMNDPFLHEQASRFAGRVWSESDDESQRIDRAYRLALGRGAEPFEIESGLQLLADVRARLHEAGVGDEEIVHQSWDAFARVLFRLNEFVYID